MKKLNQTHY